MVDCKVLTIPEVACQLGMSRNGAYRAAARGEIPTIRIGRKILVSKVAFDRMLEAASGDQDARRGEPLRPSPVPSPLPAGARSDPDVA